jgi:dihydroflavonol-4-reductase
MVESSKKKVVITGITGFLGSHVCDYFLKDGSFDVRGTVRDKKNENKLAPLRKAFGENFNKLELVEADLLKPETIDEAIKGCDYVIHTASPFPLEAPKDENVLIRPAVEGTLAAVKAAHKYKVKRIVITSSVAAIMGQNEANRKEIYNENDWTDVNAVGAYEKSKTLAEKAAWEYLHSLPEEERFELVTINPVLILGPSLISGDFSSGQVVMKLLSGKFPGMPRIMMPLVDVRDVAQAHL